MKTSFVILFLLVSVNVQSQNFWKKVERLMTDMDRNIDAQKYDEALRAAYICDSILKAEEEAESYEYGFVKRYFGFILREKGENAASDSCYILAIDLMREYGTSDDLNFTMVLNEYGLFLTEEGRFLDAEPILLEGIEGKDDKKEKKTAEYSYNLSNLGYLYYQMGKYDEAEKYLKEAIGIRKLNSKYFREDYASSLDYLTATYIAQEKYTLAIDLCKEAISQNARIYGEKSPDVAYSLAVLGDIYIALGQYNSARDLYLKALDLERAINGEKSEDYAAYLNGLAGIYWACDEYEKSEITYKKALEIETAGGFDPTESYSGLSAMYMAKADFASAEEMLRKSISIKDLTEKNSDSYLSYLSQLGNLYTLTDQYEKAEKTYKEAIERGQNIYGAESTDQAISINNLANLYSVMGEAELAKPHIMKAIEIHTKTVGETSLNVAYSLDRLATISGIERNFNEAESYQKRVIAIYEKLLGKDHTEYGNAIHGLAGYYIAEGKYNEAEPLLRQAIGIFKKIFGSSSPAYTYTLMDIAQLKDLTGKVDSAELLYLEVNRNLQDYTVRNFSFMAEKEKEAFIEDISTEFGQISSFVYNRMRNNSSLTGVVYDNQLALKGIVLQSSTALRQAVLNSNNKVLRELYEKMTATKALLLEQVKLPVSQRWLDTDSLENYSIKQEKEIGKIIKSVPGLKNISGFENNYKWQDVQNSLGERDAAVEFISFNTSGFQDTVEKILYCALVVRPGLKYPEMIPLFYESELENFIRVNKTLNDAYTADKLYKYSVGDQKAPGEKNLYDIVWKPLEGSLTGCSTVYYSPVGILNLISFDALPFDGKTYLSDRYKMVAVTSTREVIRQTDESLSTGDNFTAVFYGGINYDSDTTLMKTHSDRKSEITELSRSRLMAGDTYRGSGFSFLDGTLSEVKKIGTVLSEKKMQTRTLTGDDATEESFKALNNLSSPSSLHIATHGFFFPDPQESSLKEGLRSSSGGSIYSTSENPLLRSGLIFAGGNHIWKNQHLPSDVEDGILLASEVAEMYLPNTRLVVLSACETGLGEIRGTEGVFGLQRSFKMAGVGSLIISLWQVPDYQTSELMTKFYTNWVSGKSINDSFRDAQDYMKNKYPATPSAWAAFVLLR